MEQVLRLDARYVGTACVPHTAELDSLQAGSLSSLGYAHALQILR
jgi:hypothetical protein